MDSGNTSPYLTKDDFYEYVLDNRDRQDANKTEIISTIQATINGKLESQSEDIDDVEERVEKLEDGAKKQTLIASLIAGAAGIITGAIAYFAGG